MAKYLSRSVARLLTPLVLCTNLSCDARVIDNGRDPDYSFDMIEPSTNLAWKPCFGGLACSRLQVPLDYADTSIGTTSVAFLKIAGKNATAESQSIIIIAGGPGGSGIDQLLEFRDSIGLMLGEQYNFVSYDPRGVNHSGPFPALDCFSGNTKARAAFNRLHNNAVANKSASSFQEHFTSAAIYGAWCDDAVKKASPHGYYVTTPAVARDLLTYIDAEAAAGANASGQPPSLAAKPKLWAYAGSYGTVVGTTFATMFPDRVGRLVLDGVVNADEYYDNSWRQNVDSIDETYVRFAELCHAAGPGRCSLWRPSPGNITARLDAIIEQFRKEPVPVTGLNLGGGGLPDMVTYSDVKTLLWRTLYDPLVAFPRLADVLHAFESKGDVAGLRGQFVSLAGTYDSGSIIMCADSHQRNRGRTASEFGEYAEYTILRSRYTGDVMPITMGNAKCRGMNPELPDSMVFQGPVGGNTSFPILFTSNTVDGVTPLLSARTMSSRFPGSVVLQQEAVGHVVVKQKGSTCFFGHVQAYLGGVVPPVNVTCPQQYVPFMGDA
ncbi:alpha/beta hydrolase [Microdochium nivale]|nr:alpha/beta hydrolase [Microdochium nivale]